MDCKYKNWRQNNNYDRLRIIKNKNGSSDALHLVLEKYDKYRTMIQEKYNYMFEILYGFMKYAKQRYKNDKDYVDGSADLGKRKVDEAEETKWKNVNKISTQSLGEQVLHELLDTALVTETESVLKFQQNNMDIYRNKENR